MCYFFVLQFFLLLFRMQIWVHHFIVFSSRIDFIQYFLHVTFNISSVLFSSNFLFHAFLCLVNFSWFNDIFSSKVKALYYRYYSIIGTVPSSCYPAPSLEPIFGQYLGSGGSTDDQMMCVNEGWCPAFE